MTINLADKQSKFLVKAECHVKLAKFFKCLENDARHKKGRI